ncbi:hypothetical protein BGZ60DRAFT_514821 [Tricladium varicosporioides]|nr:hypothetical protein BGZ60DRAFT_514821 [Hymenoscyphus varicosporioides]
MEALATAASVAGVLSLAGQTIDGIIKFTSFFSDISSASRTIERFLQSLNQLIKLIEDVKSLLSSVADDGADFKIAAMEIQLDDCSKEVYRWLKVAKEHHPAFSIGTKKGFKKFWVAVHKGKVRSISEDVKEYRHEISASLLVLERAMNIAQSSQIEVVQQSLEIASQDAAIFQQNSMKQLMKIDSLEESSKASLKYSHDSLVSLASIASSIAEIERRLSSVGISSVQEIQNKPHRITKQSPKQPKSHRMWSFGGSSDGSLDCIAEDIVAANKSPINSRLLAKPNMDKMTSFKEEVTRRTLGLSEDLDDGVFETDEDDLHESAIITGDDSSDGSESIGDNNGGPINHNKHPKQVIPERLDSSPRRSISEAIPHPDRDTEASCKEIQKSHSGKSRDIKGSTIVQSYLDSDHSAIYHYSRSSQSSIVSVSHQSSSDLSLENHAIADLLETLKSLHPPTIVAYISKTRLVHTIEQQISLLSLQTTDNRNIQENVDRFRKYLENIQRRLTQLRLKCLLEGHSLHQIDEILTSCKIHDPITGLRLSPVNTAIRHADLLALRKHTLNNRYTLAAGSDSKRDMINKWLFQNLQNSPENAALHRSIMIAGMEEQLDEKAWARIVVKYWSIDEAATGLEYESMNISTNAAAHSNAGSLNKD